MHNERYSKPRIETQCHRATLEIWTRTLIHEASYLLKFECARMYVLLIGSRYGRYILLCTYRLPYVSYILAVQQYKLYNECTAQDEASPKTIPGQPSRFTHLLLLPRPSRASLCDERTAQGKPPETQQSLSYSWDLNSQSYVLIVQQYLVEVILSYRDTSTQL